MYDSDIIMAALEAGNNRPARYEIENATTAELDAYIAGVEQSARCLAEFLGVDYNV